ncbi:MAG: tRNA lysidine(34) synthetase TilS [Gammaproteobacteria bacterium RIFCSPHIGHO2_12_FULL_42_10]|nr:MAG: tRNA lysidine(34) synthetase TilS [Gammaproteobacteria bacterium RIFCSPHIGHO2_12_FULL_42_10]
MPLNTLKRFFEQYGNAYTYWIAYSGGMDSHVLLSLASMLRSTHLISLRAIYINHQLHPDASRWGEHCQLVCDNLNIPLTIKNIDLDLTAGESIEALAREKRYAVFVNLLAKDDILLTAHHQNDQAETVLIQLLRGAGPKGLAAMPFIKSFGSGQHARPLLHLSRDVLHQYAISHHLKWIEDPSNLDQRFVRNFVRHEIMPKLIAYTKGSLSTIVRSAAHCAETDALLNSFASSLLNTVKGSLPETLSVSRILMLDDATERLILRSFIHSLGLQVPDAKKLEVIQREILRARGDRNPVLCWRGVVIRRYRDDLYVLPASDRSNSLKDSEWYLKEPLWIQGVGRLLIRASLGKGFALAIDRVQIRFRQGGEKLYLKNRGHRTLKNLFQEWGIPPWERDRTPIFFLNGQCIGVLGYGLDEKYLVKANEVGQEPYLEPVRITRN